MIYTIGHSTLSELEFLDMIQPIDLVVDIRSHPHSKWAQFRYENLVNWLPERGKEYKLDLRLGGWNKSHEYLTDLFLPHNVDIRKYTDSQFPKHHIAKSTVIETREPTWTNQGLHDYSWFTTLPEFTKGMDELIECGSIQNVGIMCAETLWWKCHRSMVADYLWFMNIDCMHLQPKPTWHSKVIGNRLERYDPKIIQFWTNYRGNHDQINARI